MQQIIVVSFSRQFWSRNVVSSNAFYERFLAKRTDKVTQGFGLPVLGAFETGEGRFCAPLCCANDVCGEAIKTGRTSQQANNRRSRPIESKPPTPSSLHNQRAFNHVHPAVEGEFTLARRELDTTWKVSCSPFVINGHFSSSRR
jgi:hypothetical protein